MCIPLPRHILIYILIVRIHHNLSHSLLQLHNVRCILRQLSFLTLSFHSSKCDNLLCIFNTNSHACRRMAHSWKVLRSMPLHHRTKACFKSDLLIRHRTSQRDHIITNQAIVQSKPRRECLCTATCSSRFLLHRQCTRTTHRAVRCRHREAGEADQI